MDNIVAQSLFHTTTVKRTWRSQLTSIAVHAFLLALAFAVSFPVIQESVKPTEHVTLIAPIPQYKPAIIAPRKIEMPHIAPHVSVMTVPVPPPIVEQPKPVVAEKTEPVKMPPPAIAATLPEAPVVAKVTPPPAPTPLKSVEVKSTPAPKVVVGGFGDPNAVHASETSRPSPVLMAKVGSFESPEGAGQSGSAGKATAGGFRPTSFGSADGNASNAAGGKPAVVRTGNFGDGSAVNGSPNGRGSMAVKTSGFSDTVAAPPPPKPMQTAAAAFTPVEILYKPRPSYSSEARNMRVEGQVSLEVVFQASGAVKVVRVIRGLGHGLDEAAQQAALQVKFKPATRAGVAVDQNATISITFELS